MFTGLPYVTLYCMTGLFMCHILLYDIQADRCVKCQTFSKKTLLLFTDLSFFIRFLLVTILIQCKQLNDSVGVL